MAVNRNGAGFSVYSQQLKRFCWNSVQNIRTSFFEETGNVDPKIREYTGIKIDERVTQVILSIVFNSSNLYLMEIKDKVHQCMGLDISPPAICNVANTQKWPNKEKSTMHCFAKKCNMQR